MKILSSNEDKPFAVMAYNETVPTMQPECSKFMFLRLGVCWCILGSPENSSCEGLIAVAPPPKLIS